MRAGPLPSATARADPAETPSTRIVPRLTDTIGASTRSSPFAAPGMRTEGLGHPDEIAGEASRKRTVTSRTSRKLTMLSAAATLRLFRPAARSRTKRSGTPQTRRLPGRWMTWA